MTFTSPTTYGGHSDFPPQPPEPASSLANATGLTFPPQSVSTVPNGTLGSLAAEPKIFPGVVSQRQRRRSSILRPVSGSTSNLSAQGGPPEEGSGEAMGNSVGSLGSTGRSAEPASPSWKKEVIPEVLGEGETDEDDD